MKDEAAVPAKGRNLFSQAVHLYGQQTGQSAFAWIPIALGNLIAQIIFYRSLVRGPLDDGPSAGEFGLLNAALGIIALMTAPLLAVQMSFQLRATAEDAKQRESTATVIESLAWIWGAACFLMIMLPWPWPHLPRFPLQIFALLNVLIALGSVVSQSVCSDNGRLRFWMLLTIGAALMRVIAGTGLMHFEPWADSALIASLLAGLVTLAPALTRPEIDFQARLDACRRLFTGEFLLFAGATLSIVVGIALFINADRIVTLEWMDRMPNTATVMTVGTKQGFDSFQAAGLMGRALLWGTQPLLWIWFAQRCRLKKTTASSLTFFWLYLVALVAGALILNWLTQAHTWPLHGRLAHVTGLYGPTFAFIAVPLGLLQALGVFALASRRFHECFVFGGCSLVYALVLMLFAHRPEIILPYMFGTALVMLMVVLLVGVVRWGRKQP